MSDDNVRIERGGGLFKGRTVYALLAYDTSQKKWWARPLISILCHPKQPARWLDGKANKKECAEVLAALAKLEREVPNGK